MPLRKKWERDESAGRHGRTSTGRDRRPSHEDILDAVRHCNLRAVLEERGYEFGRWDFLKENPWRKERTSSICIRRDKPSRWHDFGAAPRENSDGDLIDFLRLAEDMSYRDALREAGRILAVRPSAVPPDRGPRRLKQRDSISERSPTEPLVPDLEPFTRRAHEALVRGTSEASQRARKFLTRRGLDPNGEVVRRMRLGVVDDTAMLGSASNLSRPMQGYLVFPYLDKVGTPRFYNTRTVYDSNSSRYRKPRGLRQVVPYNVSSVCPASPVIVVEGELDALSIMEALGPETAVIATGGGGLAERFLPHLEGIPLVYLLFDADQSGREYARAAESLLEARGTPAVQLAVPPGTKDASEALVRLGREKFRSSLLQQMERP